MAGTAPTDHHKALGEDRQGTYRVERVDQSAPLEASGVEDEDVAVVARDEHLETLAGVGDAHLPEAAGELCGSFYGALFDIVAQQSLPFAVDEEHDSRLRRVCHGLTWDEVEEVVALRPVREDVAAGGLGLGGGGEDHAVADRLRDGSGVGVEVGGVGDLGEGGDVAPGVVAARATVAGAALDAVATEVTVARRGPREGHAGLGYGEGVEPQGALHRPR